MQIIVKPTDYTDTSLLDEWDRCSAWLEAALYYSNGTHTIALKILKLLFILQAPFIVSLIGYIVSIPVFCDSAFIILNSLILFIIF